MREKRGIEEKINKEKDVKRGKKKRKRKRREKYIWRKRERGK